MDKVNAAKIKKATDFLEKWKQFQAEKDQKRRPLATKSLPQQTQDKNEQKKTERKIVTSRYLSKKSENNAPKQSSAARKDSITQKRVSILPQTRAEGTPMSIRLERWKKQKENQNQYNLMTNSIRKKTHTPLKANKKYTHVKSKLMTASSQKGVENQRKDQKKDTVKRMLSSTMKPESAKMISRGVTNSASSQVRKSLSTPAVGALNKNKGVPPKNKLRHFQGVKVSESKNKRRHSDTGSRNAQATRSILKRKSCLPSLSDEVGIPKRKSDMCTLKTPGHNVRFISPIPRKPDNQLFRKTPVRIAHTGRSMRSELEEWLKKKGKTPSGFRHLRCFDASLSAKKKAGDPVCQQDGKAPQSSVVLNLENQFTADDSLNTQDLTEEDLDSMLEECSTLYEAGCPLEDTMKWLDSIEENIDIARSSARFYICKAKILKSTDNLEEVLHVFEKAVKNCAQPADELASSLTQIITEISLERERKARLKSALAKEMDDGNVFTSSTIKYCVRQITPHKSRKRQSSGAYELVLSPCKVVTPVRRSTRRSLCSLPEQFHSQSPVYTALEDIPSPERSSTFFQVNPALGHLLEDDDM